MASHYVYAHVFTEGEVFYVGKGSGDRLLKQGKGSNLWKEVSNGKPYVAVKLAVGLTSDEAYLLESQIITFLKEFGLCRANTSYGGKGVTVPKRWWGHEISKSLTGVKRPSRESSHCFKPLDQERIKEDYEAMSTIEIGKKYGVSCVTILDRLRSSNTKIRKPGRTERPVFCVEDSKLFPSISEAAKFYGVFPENIRKVLKGTYKTTGGKTFKEP